MTYDTEPTISFEVSLGDLNGDGHLDMVTAGRDSSNDGHMTVRLGDGKGSFGEASTFASESRQSNAVELEDMNGDGVLDIITAGQSDTPAFSGGFVTVRFGVGDGSFNEATSVQVSENGARDMTIGDINGDGILDIVTASYYSNAGRKGQSSVLLGDGNGSFSTPQSFLTTSYNNFDVALGDINGDTILDLVSVGEGAGFTDEIMVQLGVGDGSFEASVSYSSGGFASYNAVELGDLNGDQILDLITINNSGTTAVRLGNNSGSFGNVSTFDLGVGAALSLDDINNDGVLDLLGAGLDGGTGRVTTLFASTEEGVSPLLDFSLNSVADAKQALSQFTQKLSQLSSQRGEIGSNQSRLQVATNILDISRENFIAAESRIRDVDVANESSNLVRMNILQQAAAAVLSQANQQPALALQLLG